MNLYKKPLSSSQYCHTEEEAVTNIHKVFYQKRLYLIYLKAFLIRQNTYQTPSGSELNEYAHEELPVP